MRGLLFLLLVLVLGCGDDSSGDPDRDGAADEGPDGGDGDGDGDDPDGGDLDASDSGRLPDGGGATIVRATIGTEGGALTSSDGKLTLSIPAGALGDDEMISIETLDEGDSRALFEDAIELASYRFEPDGLSFDTPVELVLQLDALIEPSEEPVVPLVIASTFSEGTLEYLERHELAIDLDSGDADLATEIEHFSDLSAQVWLADNELTTPYFYFRLMPMPPAEMELGKDYDIGLNFHTRHFLDEDLPLTYRDSSSEITYSGGDEPVDVGSIPGEGEGPSSFVINAGSYSCSELGGSFYRAQLVTDLFDAQPISAECESASGRGLCPSFLGGPMRYWVDLLRLVDCVPEKEPEPEPEGAPFSGYVAYQRGGTVLPGGTFQGAQGLSGAFYEGGADQADFDELVLKKRRTLGITPDRGASGTCRPAAPERFHADIFFLMDVPTSHVGEGADDLIGIDFLSPASDPLYTAAFDAVTGLYESDFLREEAFTDLGVAVHVPVSAATPTIVLPGWDENITRNPVFTPNSSLAALNGDDIAISWQADEVGGDHIHVWAIGGDADTEEAAAFECFAEIEDQLIIIPAQTIADLFGTRTDPVGISINVTSGSHTTVEYQGRTLDGFNIYQYGRQEETLDPNNPDG